MSLFFRAKLSYIPYFYPDKFYNGSQIEEKCQISLLLNHLAKTIQSSTMEQPQPSPRYSSIFFLQSRPPIQYFSTGWAIPLASFSQIPTQYLLTGWEFLGIFQPSPTQGLDHEWVCPGYFTRPPPQYLSYWEGAGNLLHHQIKLRISMNIGDSKTRRNLPKLVCTPRGGGWVQGATAGTKAPVPRGVQSKEGSPLWVPLWSP